MSPGANEIQAMGMKPLLNRWWIWVQATKLQARVSHGWRVQLGTPIIIGPMKESRLNFPIIYGVGVQPMLMPPKEGGNKAHKGEMARPPSLFNLSYLASFGKELNLSKFACLGPCRV